LSIYVETSIQTSLDEVWRHTQTPELHERWDLRFSQIDYLGPADESGLQRFRYATRLGFGLAIEGWGETVGEMTSECSRTSALRFGSEDPLSLIRDGSGYWKYEEAAGAVRFLTAYDYQVRGGLLGRLLDRILFRPVMGWATAWSFDRLRLWIESSVDPAESARRAITHATATSALTFTWIWHGVVPKLLWLHQDELAMLLEAGVNEQSAASGVRLAGVVELLFGLAFPFVSRSRWPWITTLLLMSAATVGVVVNSAHRAFHAFNPITLNVAVAALAVVGLLTLGNLPSATRCIRKPEVRKAKP